MRRYFRSLLGIALACSAAVVAAQGAKEVRIGVIYDLTGPMASSGAYPSYLGTKYAIDMFNARGGVDGYTIKPVYVDA